MRVRFLGCFILFGCAGQPDSAPVDPPVEAAGPFDPAPGAGQPGGAFGIPGTGSPGQANPVRGHEVVRSRLSGDMGQVRGFEENDALHSLYAVSETSVQLTVNARGPDWATMGIIVIDGGLDWLLVPGLHRTFSAGVLDQEHVSFVGCAGPDEGEWDFDCEAGEVEVEVGEGEDGAIEVDVEGEFDCGEGEQHAEGGFDIIVEEEDEDEDDDQSEDEG